MSKPNGCFPPIVKCEEHKKEKAFANTKTKMISIKDIMEKRTKSKV